MTPATTSLCVNSCTIGIMACEPARQSQSVANPQWINP
jgi:hypothetical protein